MRALVRTTLAGWVALAATPAWGDEQAYPIGETAAMMGGAGVAIVRDGSAPWYNPAGLGRADTEGISANVTAYGVQVDRASRFVDFGGGVTGDLAGTQVVSFPASVAYVRPLDTGAGFRHALALAVVIPDYSKREGVLELPGNQAMPATAFYARERLLEQTYWVVPAWGGCWSERFCFGLAVPVAYRASEGLYTVSGPTRSAAGGPATFMYTEEGASRSTGVGLAAGLQWRAAPGCFVGAQVRSPVRALHGSGNVLAFDSGRGLAMATEIRRVEDQALRVDQRLPAQGRVGVGYDRGRLRLGIDVVFSLAQARYAQIRASDGATALTSAPGDPPIPIARDGEADAVIDLALGAELGLSARTSLLLGAYSDRATRPRERVDELHPRIDRYGGTLGIGYRGGRATTYLGVIASFASGTAYGATAVGTRRWADAHARSVLVTLGGSAEFADPPPAGGLPDQGVPIYRKWWFWTAFSAVLGGGIAAAALGHRRTDIGAPLP